MRGLGERAYRGSTFPKQKGMVGSGEAEVMGRDVVVAQALVEAIMRSLELR